MHGMIFNAEKIFFDKMTVLNQPFYIHFEIKIGTQFAPVEYMH